MTEQYLIPEKIFAAINRQKKFVDSLIGYTTYDWRYAICHYEGMHRVPVPFELYDEVVCGLLAVKEMNQSEIGAALGMQLDEEVCMDVLKKMLNPIEEKDMIAEREGVYSLTNYGKRCLERMQKPEEKRCEFEIYKNVIGKPILHAHKIFKDRERNYVTRVNGVSDSISVEEYAAEQVPEIHCPDNDFVLLDYWGGSATVYSFPVGVAILCNGRDKSLSAQVYDIRNEQLLPELTESLNDDTLTMQQILSQIAEESRQTDLSTQYMDLYNSSWREEERAKDISNTQQQLQQEYDEAEQRNDQQRMEELKKIEQTDKLYFSAPEFEAELRRLFESEPEVGELWLISPWIKKASERLIPFIQTYLNKGGRVFVCYSMAEGDSVMAEREQLMKFEDLDERYDNFYLCRQYAFHDKHLLVRDVKQPVHFSGSYNILSFNGLYKSYNGKNEPSQKYIRQEMMQKSDWNNEFHYRVFLPFMDAFATKYFEQAEDLINEEEMHQHIYNADRRAEIKKKLKAIKLTSLKPFIKLGVKFTDDNYKSSIEDKYAKYNERYTRLEALRKELLDLIDKQDRLEKEAATKKK